MTPSLDVLMGMTDPQLQQLVQQGQIQPDTVASIKRAQAARAGGGGGESPLSAAAPFRGPTTGIGMDPSQAWRPPPTPEANAYAVDLPNSPSASSRAPVPSPAGAGGPSTPAALPAIDGGPREDALRIQDKLEGQAGVVAGHAREAMRAQDNATEKAKTAIDSQAALDAQRAAEQANLAKQEAARQQAETAAYQQQRADREASLQRTADELRGLEKDAASFKIDPDRKTSSFGGRILAGLAVGLGQYAATVTGTRNTAADLVRQAIEDDIAAQRDELMSKRGAVQAKSNELADLSQRLGSWDRGQEALRLRLATEAKARIDSVLSEYTAPEKLAEAQKAKSQLDAIAADSRAKILQSSDRDTVQALSVAGGLAEKTMGIDRRMGMAGTKLLPAVEASKIADKVSALEMIDGLERDFRGMTGPGSAVTRHFDASQSSQYDVRRQNVANELTTKMFGTRASDAERKNMLNLVPMSSDYSGSEAPNKFQALRQSAIEKLRNEIDSQRAAGFDVSRYEALLAQKLRQFGMDAPGRAAALGGVPRG